MEKLLTTVIIGEYTDKFEFPKGVDVIYSEDGKVDLDSIKTKYINFINSDDDISEKYYELILEQCKTYEFDCGYIANIIDFDVKSKRYIIEEKGEITNRVPYEASHIWEFFYKVSKLKEFESFEHKEDVKGIREKLFIYRVAISEPIYFHKHGGKIIDDIFGLPNRKPVKHISNIIYMDWFCNGLFNGYISWLKHIGRYLKGKKSMTVMFSAMIDPTQKLLSEYFNLEKWDAKVNYTCDRFITTYSTYFYPLNITCLKESYMFIHGNMSDYKHSRRFTDDIYDRYIGVSKISAEKAKGYFPTDNFEVIYNPFVLEESDIKPHLKLISATRNSPEKNLNRMKKMAKMLDELKIPYTWQIFTDVTEANVKGLIFRNCVQDVMNYIADADYLVCLSDTEALSYAMVEALSAGTKVIATKLEATDELEIEEGKNGILLPFDYFEDGNEDKLKEKLQEAYKIKDVKFDYVFKEELYKDIIDIFE